jgi:secernin
MTAGSAMPGEQTDRWAPRSRNTRQTRVACDSLVALGKATADGSVLFAKNSDRPADECQPLILVPRMKHPPGSRLRCQYLEIPQVAETARMMASQPFWLWGFEHGLNEHGVAIGNHTVFTRDHPAATGLTGMDLVRLGLERAHTAPQAVDVITALTECHGQGGSGFLDLDFPYHNSFLVADRREAYLIETSGRHWVLRRVHGVGSATNHLTIHQDWDALSADAERHAVESGWWSKGHPGRFDFAAAYRDANIVPAHVSSARYRRTCEFLDHAKGTVTPAMLMAALRDHYGGPMHQAGIGADDARYYSICMHADPVGTTTASMVARLAGQEDEPLCYWACLGSPCTGVFLPYYVDAEVPDVVCRGGSDPAEDSAWWSFKKLLSLVERDPQRHGSRVRAFWNEFEQNIFRAAAAVEQDAAHLRQRGNFASAKNLLSNFVHERVSEMIQHLARLTYELDKA